MTDTRDPKQAIADAVADAEPLSGQPGPDLDDEAHDPGDPPPPDDDIDWDVLRACAAEAQNDTGNSRRLRHRFGRDIIHVQSVAVFAYDGRRWAEDIDGRVSRPLCHKVADSIMLEPIVMAQTEDEQAAIEAAEDAVELLKAARLALMSASTDDEKAALRTEISAHEMAIALGRAAKAALTKRRVARRRFAVSTGNTGKIAGMLAEAIPYMSRAITDLDTDAMALNLPNGTLRFVSHEEDDPDCPDPDVTRTKTTWQAALSPHRREDMISKLADADFVPDAQSPVFDAFLQRVLPNAAVRAFVQRFFGYGLTALTSEQMFVLFHGEGRNGKSTLVDIMARIMGDYSTSLPIATLVNENRTGKGSEATPDLARLPGARLVRAAEPKEGMGFDESLIKSLTSDEAITVRRLQKEFIDIYPEFKLVISANRKPTIRGNDDGIWRRVKLVPFDVQIPEAEVDKRLSDKLWAERSGILNWAVAGCLDYLRRGGLDAPDEVKAATEEYREESDIVGAFVRQAVIVTKDPYDTIEVGQLYPAFVRYCSRNGITPLSNVTFSRRMPKAASQAGFTKQKQSISVYVGIQLRDEFKAHSASSHDDAGG
jgi:putative DNA primase/helicase